MSTYNTQYQPRLHRRGAGADDKFEEYKWFTICTVLALFGLGFLGFAVSELWAARIQAKMLDNKVFKAAVSTAKKNDEYGKRKKQLKALGVDETEANNMFAEKKYTDVVAMRK